MEVRGFKKKFSFSMTKSESALRLVHPIQNAYVRLVPRIHTQVRTQINFTKCFMSFFQ